MVKRESKRGDIRTCSVDNSESKSIHVDNIKSKRINIKKCSRDESESEIIHEMDIRVNTNKVKDTKDEEPLFADNSNIEVITEPGYFKLFDYGKTFFNNLDTTYECV